MIVVVGAGAAGLVAAASAAATGAKVLLVERTSDGGRKILISGGGRCNILPSSLSPERFVTDSPPHLLRHMLRAWPLHEQRAFFEQEVGIPLALEVDSGKLFPVSNQARDVRDGLRGLAERRGVEFQGNTTVTNLTRTEGGWTVDTSRGPIDADAVVLATGGLSVPATGSDGTGLRIAGALGHLMTPTYPALTPLLGPAPGDAAIAGVSLTAQLRAKSAEHSANSTGGFLFTHRGYSGPAVLDVSHVATRSTRGHAEVRVAWTTLSHRDWEDSLASAGGKVLSVVARHVPERLAVALCTSAGVPLDRRGPELRRSERVALIDHLTAYPLPWTGDEGYKKAEVTGGGVRLDEVDRRTLESRRAPGIFLCGEILDAFGPIGGYNFAWAWATGRTAGLGAARRQVNSGTSGGASAPPSRRA
ncbi:MAG: flavoprotein [Acidimicrobiia bacterium]